MKKILITGCSSGFGFDAAKYLAEKGHHIYATMRNVKGSNSEKAKELESFAKDNGYSIEVIELDVVSDESVKNAINHIDEVDVLINNAGRGFGGPLEAFTSKQILDQLDLNIVGTARVANAVLPKMRAKKSGLIIQVSSTAGRGAFPGFGVYHASKWGLEGMSEAMRYELSPLGIDVVLVEPGPFDTNFFGAMVYGEDQEIAQAYQHVGEFFAGFEGQVKSLFEDENAPTDPMVVVKIFEDLINSPAGERPIRTIAGLDFGFQAMNDATEPIRKAGLEGMGISEWDGPKG
ncbi:SDR family oxidoreductase [Algoriphagus sediminis]|uniref:SDR family oxidoreductase n=1 Tax=Algoriphagus sediminis TaxID=3057113 RepID=A0ABT7YG93_9BACT|nr:SDR family oxidoreductase [Algoriphagus sediminis]MDN3205547.1 SDR family oxidoreductase [Algoriphagus sediminis]